MYTVCNQAVEMTRKSAFAMTLLELIRPGCVDRLSLSPPYILIVLAPIAVFLSLEIFVGIFAQNPKIAVPEPTKTFIFNG